MPKQRVAIGGPPDYLVNAIVESMEPLVRLFIAKGITYPVAADLLSALFVKVASREFTLEDKAQTQSRISVITGIHRREVKRLTDRKSARAPDVISATRGGELVSRWVSTAPFIGRRGKPLPLPRLASQGGEASFEALVASFSKDIRPRAILDEWLRLGVVTLDEEDRVCLNIDSFVPAQGTEERAFYFGQNIGDHLAAAVANLLGHSPAFPDRSVYRDELSPESIARLTRMAERLSMNAILKVNREAERLEPSDKREGKATHRMNFGFYIYGAPMTAAGAAAKTPERTHPRRRSAKRTT